MKEKRISPTSARVGSEHHDNCMWSSNTLTEQIYSIKFNRNGSICGEKQFEFKSCNTCDREKIDRHRLRTPFRRTNNVRNLNWTRVLRGTIFISAPYLLLPSKRVAHRFIFISCDSISFLSSEIHTLNRTRITYFYVWTLDLVLSRQRNGKCVSFLVLKPFSLSVSILSLLCNH